MRRIMALVMMMSIVLSACTSTRHFMGNKSDISPYKYGLTEAKTGIERYNVLLKSHQAAIIAGVNVDYSDIDTIRLVLPPNPVRIPLTQFNDFKGCVIVVTNNSQRCNLFDFSIKATPVKIEKKSIDAGGWITSPQLSKGRYILMIEDEKPWVKSRKGYAYGHTRKDILLIENGKAANSVVMPYNNPYSSPKCSYIPVDEKPVVIKNLKVYRDKSCTFVTTVMNIAGYNNVQIDNIHIITPESKLDGDAAIRISNCTNVALSNVSILGTYSQFDSYGYGISLNNIWNFKASNLVGKGKWGIFGNTNVNEALVEYSQINRFDIHCYGRNVSFKNVEFFDLYNQFSSVFGNISFTNCTFTNFLPVLIETSYNSYVGFDLNMKNCVFNASPTKNYLVHMGQLSNEVNLRSELSKKCWPNVNINNLTVNMAEGCYEFGIFRHKTIGDGAKVDYISDIKVNGLSIIPHPSTTFQRLYLCNNKVVTSRPVDFEIINSGVIHTGFSVKTGNIRKDAILDNNMPILNGRAKMTNVKNIRQK